MVTETLIRGDQIEHAIDRIDEAGAENLEGPVPLKMRSNSRLVMTLGVLP